MQLSLSERILRFIESASSAVAGSNGNGTTFSVTVAIVLGFDLDDNTALYYLKIYNERKCEPQWTDRELDGFICDARRKGKMEVGHFLKEGDRPHSVTSTSRASTPSKPVRTATIYTAEQRAEKEGKQRQWTANPPRLELSFKISLADSRCVLLEAVEIMDEMGLLHLDHVFDHADGKRHPAYVFAYGQLRQARRMDGVPWTQANGNRVKAKNLPGFVANSFFGYVGPSQHPVGGESVLIVEGVIGYLEALGALLLAGPNPNRWQILAAHSAQASAFINDPELLATIAGRHIRIVQDNDPSGHEGAATWAEELTTAGCALEIVTLPAGCKDLGDLLKAPPEEAIPSLTAILEINK